MMSGIMSSKIKDILRILAHKCQIHEDTDNIILGNISRDDNVNMPCELGNCHKCSSLDMIATVVLTELCN